MPSGRTLRLVADASSNAKPATAASDDDPAEPPDSPAIEMEANASAGSRTHVANDAVAEPPERGNEETAGSDAPDAENPASAPRAKVVGPEEPVAPRTLTVPPPADPTEIPADAVLPERPVVGVPAKPLLASDALMEDLAPLEPSRDVARFWCAAVGLGFAALGSLPLLGLRPGGSATAGLSFFMGGVTVVAALSQVTYRKRAFAMLVIGVLVVLTGLGGTGPAAFIAHQTPGVGLARAFAAVALPGALLFRARYRAYSGARWALGAAFVLTIPFFALVLWRLVTQSPDLSMAGALIALVVMLVGLVGFMGKETTGAGTYVGLSVLFGLGADLFFVDLSYVDVLSDWRGVLTTSLGSAAFISATGLAALGLFQLLASRLSGEARQIDLHAATPEPERARTNKSEWTA